MHQAERITADSKDDTNRDRLKQGRAPKVTQQSDSIRIDSDLRLAADFAMFSNVGSSSYRIVENIFSRARFFEGILLLVDI